MLYLVFRIWNYTKYCILNTKYKTVLVYHFRLMSNKRLAFIVLAISVLTHFAFFGHPDQTVFDEVHFGKFISGYYTHEYFFDIHPPLGKLIIAGFGKFFDFEPEFSFATIGDKFPDKSYMALRFLPSVAGTLLPLVLFALALELGISRYGAFASGFLAAIENSLITQSRFILLDAFLLLFGFAAFFCYARFWRRGGSWWLFSAGILATLAVSIKWTGGSFLGIIGLIELYRLVSKRAGIRHWIMSGIALVAIPFVIYYMFFALHFSLLYKSGSGDSFMSVGFQKTLAGNAYEHGINIAGPTPFGKFIELNAQMYLSNQRLTATHPYSSPWYAWPLMIRPIFYWISSSTPITASGSERIYLMGNPLLWYMATVAMLMLMLRAVMWQENKPLAWIIIGGYVINLLPFIGVKRVMFLYHYFIPLIFAIGALIYILESMPNARRKLAAVALISLISFLYFAPLTYGLPLDSKTYERRLWLETWR